MVHQAGQHLERSDPALIATSKIVVADTPSQARQRFAVAKLGLREYVLHVRFGNA